ncbi:uncharacterized protein LOC125776347 isoform X2 [Bactrocera dorsalis]|uniref:Regulatory protein zeste n=1 Tax=Bactrocera dorsalis TaxID=27457 RepID=A0ABM3J4C6_BACDO|nr:uncharacterized protein LOC125776347 isoform X2 [Bactrocera dorsalis]
MKKSNSVRRQAHWKLRFAHLFLPLRNDSTLYCVNDCQICAFNIFLIRYQTGKRNGQKMEHSKNKQTNPTQFEILINYMKTHSELSKGQLKTVDAKNAANYLWKELVCDLNVAGPPSRDVLKWKKVWLDYKTHLKAKMRRNKVSISGTGGGPPSHYSLTPLEEQVSELLAMEISVSGISGASEFGAAQLTQPSGSDITTDEFRQNEPTPVDEMPHCSRQRVAPQKKDSLLNKQVDNQIAYHKGSLKVLSESNENLKVISKCMKKKHKMAKRKYILAVEKFEHKKRIDLDKTKLKFATLELKKQMLEIERSDQ